MVRLLVVSADSVLEWSVAICDLLACRNTGTWRALRAAFLMNCQQDLASSRGEGKLGRSMLICELCCKDERMVGNFLLGDSIYICLSFV
jgi:hypothetical protein